MDGSEARKWKVWTCYFTRSEEGPLQPLLNELNRRYEIDCRVFDMQQVPDINREVTVHGQLNIYKPDMVLCSFDRPEMVTVAYIAYHKHIPISQIFAGDVAGGAWDDADRYAISNYANICFCADIPAYNRLQKALEWKRICLEDSHIFLSGATHFDDMGYEAFNDEGYNLVLYNPPSLASDDQIREELKEIREEIDGKKTYWAAPNRDPRSNIITEFAKELQADVSYLDNMPRKKFLGILKNADLFVGNSSSMFYEAQFWNVPIKQIGVRNRYREPIGKDMCRPGASKMITARMLEYLRGRQ